MKVKTFKKMIKKINKTNLNKKSFYLSSFGEKYNGELFLIDYNGSLYEIIPLEEQVNKY